MVDVAHKINDIVVRLFKKVVLIDAKGVNLGSMDSREALSMAMSEVLDLVLVSSTGVPTCKIFDYQKFLYNLKKKKKNIPKNLGTSCIKFGLGTDIHDYKVKVRKVLELLKKGYKVTIALRCKGRREMAHMSTGGMEMVQRVLNDLDGVVKVEQTPRIDGKMVKALVSSLSSKGTNKATGGVTNDSTKDKKSSAVDCVKEGSEEKK